METKQIVIKNPSNMYPSFYHMNHLRAKPVVWVVSIFPSSTADKKG